MSLIAGKIACVHCLGVASEPLLVQCEMMTDDSPLDDPATSSFAWARYGRLMRWMAAIALVAATIAIMLLRARHPDASIHLYIAAAAGLFMSVILGFGLMGLVFLSAGTGHDEVIENRLEEEAKPHDISQGNGSGDRIS